MTETTNAILIDDPGTWPAAVLEILEANHEILREHAFDQMRVELLRKNEANANIQTWEVMYSRQRNEVMARMQALLDSSFVTAFHCSRLTEEEIEDVLSSGLNPLEVDFTLKRIARLESRNQIPAAVAEKLRSKNAISNRHGDRLDQVCFLLCSQTLKREQDVFGLLSRWGGEALHWGFEKDPDVGAVLRDIGTPCIVEAQIPRSLLETYHPLEEMLVVEFLARHDASLAGTSADAGRIRVPLDAGFVEAVHRFADASFASLTDMANWKRKLDNSLQVVTDSIQESV